MVIWMSIATYGLVMAQVLDRLQYIQWRVVPDLERLAIAVGHLAGEQRAVGAALRTESDHVGHRDLAHLGIRIRKERQHLMAGGERHDGKAPTPREKFGLRTWLQEESPAAERAWREGWGCRASTARPS